MSSDIAKTWADRWSIELVIKPKGKKAWLAVRHHAILRSGLHNTELQLKAEGVRVIFANLLAECVMAKNCLLSAGDGSPYQSLYGRIPRMLPHIEDIAGTSRLQDETGPEGLRHVHRLRETSIASTLKAMA